MGQFFSEDCPIFLHYEKGGLVISNKKIIFVILAIGAIGILSGFSLWFKNSEIKIWPSLTFSSDGQYLIISINYKGNRNLYKVQIKNGEVNQLTFSQGSHIDASYSPDDSQIVFAFSSSTQYGAEHDLYLMDASGLNRKRLTSGSAHDFAPIFSPDGGRIYFIRAKWFGNYSPIASSHWHEMDIYSIALDGSDLKQITNGHYYEVSTPSISPDGKKMLTRLKADGDDSIWIFSIGNPEIRKKIEPNLKELLIGQSDLSESRNNPLSEPRFSPDGNSLLFNWAANTQGVFDYEFYIMNFVNQKIRKITNLKSYTISPVFSPNGKQIAFLSDPKRNDSYELCLINSDGSNARRIDIRFENKK